jgi:hypothetical protein
MLLDCRNCGTRFDTTARLADGDCCSDDCTTLLRRRLLATLPPTPMSIPHTQMHARPAAPTRRAQQIPGRDLLEADRRKAAPPGPTPKERAHAALLADRAKLAVSPPTSRTLSLRDALEALAAMSAQDSERLNSERENDMHIRAAGLRPHNAELEKRRTAGAVEKRQLPDLTG